MHICGVGREMISPQIQNSGAMGLLMSTESMKTLWLHTVANGTSRLLDKTIALTV